MVLRLRKKHRKMIKLVPFKEEDFEKLISWIENEKILVQFAGAVVFTYPLTKEQLETYIADDKRFAFKVVEVETNETVGHAEIYLVKPNVSRLCRVLIGREEYRGKGIGRQIMAQLMDYSFNRLSVEVVELNVYDWNTAAIKCYEKVGFTINPSVSSRVEVDGGIWTSVNMRVQRNTGQANGKKQR